MLDHLHRGDQIEPGAFITQGPDLARAIVDLQTHFGGVAPGDCDVLRRGVDRRHLRAKPGERRSKEHTSELQSLMRISYAVFCSKKTKISQHVTTNHHDDTPIHNQTYDRNDNPYHPS